MEKLMTSQHKVTSTGGSSSYYELPTEAKELDDLIIAKDMPWHIANIFKACYRYGKKGGQDRLYDANKIHWFITKELAKLEKERNE